MNVVRGVTTIRRITDRKTRRKPVAHLRDTLPVILALFAADLVTAPHIMANEPRAPIARAQFAPVERADEPARAAIASFLGEAHPVFARATFHDPRANSRSLTIRGFPRRDGGDDAAIPVLPEYAISALALETPWRNMTLTARDAFLIGDHLILLQLALDNDAGSLRADAAVFSQGALAALGAAIARSAPGTRPATTSGDVILNGVRVSSTAARTDDPDRAFTSSLSADFLRFDELVWRAPEDRGEAAAFGIGAFVGEGMSGEALYAGAAEYSLARIAFEGSPERFANSLMERLSRPPQPRPAAVAVPQEPAIDAYDDAARDSFIVPPPPPGPEERFALSFEDLRFSATRERSGTGPASTIAARSGMVRGRLAHDGLNHFAASIAGGRISPSVFAGTPAQEFADEIARGIAASGASADAELQLDLAAEAALSPNELRLDIPCMVAPGLLDLSAGLDLRYTPPADGGARRGALAQGLALMNAVEAKIASLAVVDHGLNAVWRTFSDIPLSGWSERLLAEQFGSGGDFRTMMLQSAFTPVTTVLARFEEQGSIALDARYPEFVALPVALIAFLQSAKPVEEGAEGSACDPQIIERLAADPATPSR